MTLSLIFCSVNQFIFYNKIQINQTTFNPLNII